MKRFSVWIALILAVSLIAGCSDAGGYIKDHYTLSDIQGKGKDNAKIYTAEGKDVPTVAAELSNAQKPEEKSKISQDQMFLVYSDKIVNLQKDLSNSNNTLVELDSVQYARENYHSSFLEGYLTASILQSVLGGGWFSNKTYTTDYKGYSTVPRSASAASSTLNNTQKPSTSSRSGIFNTKKSTSQDSISTRKNDGSSPSVKSSSKPFTSKRSGSFSKRR